MVLALLLLAIHQKPIVPQQRQGLIPGALRVAERVAPILQRLFNREPLPTERRPGEPTAGARFAPIFRLPQRRDQPVVGLTGAQPPAPRGDFYAETVRIANEMGVTPTEAAQLIQQQGLPAPTQEKFGPPGEFAPPTVGEFEYDPVSGFPVFPGGKLGRHSSIIEWYLDNGLLPFSLYPEDVARFGWTDAELMAAGYVEDAWGNWVRVGMDPNAPAVAAGGGGGGYPAYPRGGGGGGGGGGYTAPSRGPYPQSFVGRASTQFPQSFVQQGRRGVTPTGSSTRPARMGVINWRI